MKDGIFLVNGTGTTVKPWTRSVQSCLPEVVSAFLTPGAHPDGVVPAAHRHGQSGGRAVVAHALPTRPAVVLGNLVGERHPAQVTRRNLVIRNPVGRSR